MHLAAAVLLTQVDHLLSQCTHLSLSRIVCALQALAQGMDSVAAVLLTQVGGEEEAFYCLSFSFIVCLQASHSHTFFVCLTGVGYTQGMNFVAAVLLTQVGGEEEAFHYPSFSCFVCTCMCLQVWATPRA